ncbi:hypothetical protein RKE29_22610, partial [Streptomyces sp. B1866]|nr:hypothetical protein [Streptomyces sp. B1866]
MAKIRPWTRRPARRLVRGAVAGALAMAALTAAASWFSGSDERALDGACGGALAVGAVRAVLGGGEVGVRDRTTGTFGGGRPGTLSAWCQVSAGRERVEVTVSGAPRPAREHGLGALYPPVPTRVTLPVPLGQGWAGLLATDRARPGGPPDGETFAAVHLACARGLGSLLVTSRSVVPGGPAPGGGAPGGPPARAAR